MSDESSVPKAPPAPRKPVHLISPAGFLLVAAVLSAVFAVCHLCGLREDVSMLTGSSFATEGSGSHNVAAVVLYLVSYVATVFLVPVLVIAAGLFAAIQRLSAKAPATPPTQV